MWFISEAKKLTVCCCAKSSCIIEIYCRVSDMVRSPVSSFTHSSSSSFMQVTRILLRYPWCTTIDRSIRPSIDQPSSFFVSFPSSSFCLLWYFLIFDITIYNKVRCTLNTVFVWWIFFYSFWIFDATESQTKRGYFYLMSNAPRKEHKVCGKMRK